MTKLKVWFLAFATAICLMAQSTGSLTGVVQDSQGSVIVGAEVTAENSATGLRLPTTANEAGIYLFPSLPVGEYRVSVAYAGFRTKVKSAIRLQIDQRLTANFELDVAGVQTQVQVESAQALLETTTSTLTQVVETRRINDLPLNGRNVLSLLGLQAGYSGPRNSDQAIS
ncbi:MAG TPA: carboxypeptidase-like regulatory domain-containing protein [Bryobacteraceae bacterium]|nr:carboxypeptidase-like regulatory domain-containing protein [Bryobacteraceae bacterium]